jgi:hypothetical protein
MLVLKGTRPQRLDHALTILHLLLQIGQLRFQRLKRVVSLPVVGVIMDVEWRKDGCMSNVREAERGWRANKSRNTNLSRSDSAAACSSTSVFQVIISFRILSTSS